MSFPLVAPRPRRITALPYSYRTQASPVARMMSPPADALSRLKLQDSDAQVASFQPQDDASPPPSAGRSSVSPLVNLPSDALEEFLSILRPALFCPSSPTFLTRRSEPAYAYASHVERPQPFRSARESMQIKSPLAASLSTTADEGFSAAPRPSESSPAPAMAMEALPLPLESQAPLNPSVSTTGGLDQPSSTGMGLWRSPSLSFPRWLRAESPVSRTHTRNPFHRHPSYDATPLPVSSSGGDGLPPLRSATQMQMSPALLPLPRSRSPSPAPVSLSPIESEDSEERLHVGF